MGRQSWSIKSRHVYSPVVGIVGRSLINLVVSCVKLEMMFPNLHIIHCGLLGSES